MKNAIYGAIIGDIVGVPYEFVHPRMKSMKFKMFNPKATYSDDTVCTVALAETIKQVPITSSPSCQFDFKNAYIDALHKYAAKYPNAGYGGMFRNWCMTMNREPYNSYGNGAAMRISPIGQYYDDLDTMRKVAKWSSEITHNHPESLKAVDCMTYIMWMIKHGYDKETIITYIKDHYNYDFNRTIDEIRPKYDFDVTCQGSVPESIIAFFEGNSYEECIRKVISLGGDSDTQGAITGTMAGLMYDIPDEILQSALPLIPKEFRTIIDNVNIN